MSRTAAFIYSFFITLFVCFSANAKQVDNHSPLVPLMLDNSILTLAVAEISKPPKHVLIESDKILRYQLAHRYTVFCPKENYAALDFTPNGNLIKSVLLVSGQSILLDKKCNVRFSKPTKTTYIYKIQ